MPEVAWMTSQCIRWAGTMLVYANGLDLYAWTEKWLAGAVP
jgi:hypothetical protein